MYDWESWRSAFAATLLISVIPNVILVAVPDSLLKKSKNRLNFQNIFLCFASGALLGDIFLHLIPHLLSHTDNHNGNCNHLNNSNEKDKEVCNMISEDGHDHSTFIGIVILFGFLLFFVIEKVFYQACENSTEIEVPEKCEDTSKTAPAPKINSDTIHFHLEFKANQISSSGWLNLIADSLHNFTDGLAIGASFSSGVNKKSTLAFSTLLTVLFHEIPHEISDFTILIQSGMSKWQAIRLQFVTALAAFLGTFIGLYAERNELVEKLLLSLTAGGFLYVATVNILPKIAEGDRDHAYQQDSWRQRAVQTSYEILSFIVGVGMMYVVQLLEEGSEGHGHQHGHRHQARSESPALVDSLQAFEEYIVDMVNSN